MFNALDPENLDSLYVGSTCDSLDSRFKQHKQSSKAHPNRKVYRCYNVIGWNNVEIELVELFSCNNRSDLLDREFHFIKSLSPRLNSSLDTHHMTRYKHYYQQNKVVILDRARRKYHKVTPEPAVVEKLSVDEFLALRNKILHIFTI